MATEVQRSRESIKVPLCALILEDDARDVELTVAVLARGGYSVRPERVSALEEFEEKIKKNDYDVILADFNLRSWNALDALKVLKKSGKNIPLIIVTGYLDDITAAECVKQGAADYLLKDRMARLPYAVARALSEKAERDHLRATKSSLSALILEDAPEDAKLMVATLIHAGYDVAAETAVTPREFGEKVGKKPYDVILADYDLRDWTALDALEMLKKSGKDIPLVIVTGRLGDEAATECLKQGAADYLLKDRIARLPMAVQRALEDRNLREERKRAERALQRSEAKFRRLAESNLIGIMFAEIGGRFLSANEVFLKMIGYTQDEMAAENLRWDQITPPEYAASDAEAFEQFRKHGVASPREKEYARKDGTRVPVLEGGALLDDSTGECVCFAVDLTERKRAEAENARLVAAIEQSAEAVMITDIHGEIQYVNSAFSRFTGYAREEALGRNTRILKSGQQDAAFYRQLWETILKGEVWHGELINRRKDGSLYPEEMNITPVRNAQGEITHFIAAKQDVTLRKGLEQQLRQAQKMEAVGRLAGGIAHDFNNLLTIIAGYCDLLLSRLPAEEAFREGVKEIQKAEERAASLTRQLLAFSRQQVLTPQILDLNEVVASMDKMLRRLIGEDIELNTVCAKDLGRVKADPGQLEQVILNLAVNGRDAMPEGGKLTLETANVELDEAYARAHIAVKSGPYVMLAVSDTGCGMDAEVQSHIFEPFFTTKVQGKGTGLGLSTVYGIVKQSGGNIWIYSEPGQGTTFKVYLPRVEELSEPVKPVEPRTGALRGAETVLLVEDEAPVRALVRGVLEARGYTVLEASHGADALTVSERHDGPIHLLLTDVLMPRISGKELARRVLRQRPQTKVLYMSGYTDDTTVRHGVLEPGSYFLQKPFTPEALARKVREVLEG